MAPYAETSPLAAALGAASGWVQAQRDAKDREAQLEAQRQAQAQAAARLALDRQSQEFAQRHTAFEENRETLDDRIQRGLDPVTGQPFKPSIPPPPKGSNDAAMADWARKVSTLALKAGNTGIAQRYLDVANSYDTGAYREAQASYNTAGAGLRGAQTKNVEGLFDQQLRLAGIHATAAERVAGIRAARAGAAARGNPYDRAYASALQAIGNEQVRAAVQGSVDLYNQQSLDYRAGFDQNGQPTTPAPQLQMPNISITVVPGPDGRPIPIARPTFPKPPPPRTAPTRNAEHQPVPQGNPISQIFDFFGNLLHGGASGGHRIVQKNARTGEYRHSVDGGKTWQPGP